MSLFYSSKYLSQKAILIISNQYRIVLGFLDNFFKAQMSCQLDQ